jgi:hypothetical protein
MPLNTVQLRLKSVLDQLPLPQDLGILQAFIQPFNPNTDGTDACAYIWGSHGDETRLSKPRALPGDLSTGGDKTIHHSVDIWLVWFGEAEDPRADSQFPAVIDAVTACLRNTTLLGPETLNAVDPITGQQSNLSAIGEDMQWNYAPVRAVADQRYLRYDAQITCQVTEVIQA